MKQPQHPHGIQLYGTETPLPAAVTQRDTRIATAKLLAKADKLGVQVKGETTMGINKKMTDEEWTAKYGDRPRIRHATPRSILKLRYGRQSGDVKEVLTVFKSQEKVTPDLVWEFYDFHTREDWHDAYGTTNDCKMVIRHVLLNIVRGDTKGPHMIQSGVDEFIYKPDIDTPIEYEVTVEEEEQPTMSLTEFDAATEPVDEEPAVTYSLGLSDLTLIGHTLKDVPLYQDGSGIIGILVFTPLT